MALITDGIYKIHNVAYPNSVVDLINGVLDGPVEGYGDRSVNVNDKWNVVNIGEAGNQITLESVSTPGYFVSAQNTEGTNLAGTTRKTVWNVIKVDRGFIFEAPDYFYVWRLLGGDDYTPILLVGPEGQDDTKWTFERV